MMEEKTHDLRPRNIVQVKELQGASRKLTVIPIAPEQGRYLVESASRQGGAYYVTLAPGELRGACTCLWAQHGGINCKHVMAALRERYAAEGAISFWRSDEDARRQHRRTERGDGLFVTLRPRRAS